MWVATNNISGMIMRGGDIAAPQHQSQTEIGRIFPPALRASVMLFVGT